MKGKKKNLLAVLNGEQPERNPIWLMRQAGRYLPEYRALRTKAGSFMDLCFNPEYAATVTLQPIQRFGMDGAILFSDILVVPYALGFDLTFVEGEGPKLQTLGDAQPVFLQKNFFDRSQNIYETVRRVTAQLDNQTTMIGFAGSPWTVACYMLGGKGRDEFQMARARANENPVFFGKLLDILVEATSFYLKEQVKAGAECLQLFDSWSGLVPPDYFEEWVINPTRAIVRNVKNEFPTIPIIGFPRMAGQAAIKNYCQQTGVNAVSLDQTIDWAWAEKNLAEELGMVLQGNLAPNYMLGTKTEMIKAAEKIMQSASRPFIFNLGHGLTPEVPPENVAALVDFVHGYGGN